MSPPTMSQATIALPFDGAVPKVSVLLETL
jgi:hypothetical protein